MSLYHEAASILSSSGKSGSLKSQVYQNQTGLKSKPSQLYALIIEVSKYDVLLKKVIENAGILKHESKVCLSVW